MFCWCSAECIAFPRNVDGAGSASVDLTVAGSSELFGGGGRKKGRLISSRNLCQRCLMVPGPVNGLLEKGEVNMKEVGMSGSRRKPVTVIRAKASNLQWM